ncbi:MAG: IS256 family transposase [Actinomycetota bacterium]
MGKRSRPRIVSKDHLDLEAFPEQVQVALAEVAGAAREGVLALSVACGLQVVNELLATDVERICGPKGKHDADRAAYRHGTEPRQLPLGGALVHTVRPRARTTGGREVTLPVWEAFSSRDLLSEIALGRMLAGLSARRYRAGSEPVGEVELRGTSRSAISRRFRRATEARLAELFGKDLSGLDLLAVFIDGMHVGEHLIVVALGVDSAGRKHPLGLWEGTTENAAVCRALVGSLVDRGLRSDRAMLFVTDGGRAIATVIRETWGDLALHQRCRNHKLENITGHLPERERTFIARKVRAAWSMNDAAGAERELRGIARHLESAHPGAAASILEGLEETLTVTRLGLPPSLCRTFKTTNPIESMISIARDATRNVKRWRNGKMALRWIAAGMLEAERQFRKVDGHRDLHVLKRALERHQGVIEGTKKVA